MSLIFIFKKILAHLNRFNIFTGRKPSINLRLAQLKQVSMN